MQKVDRSKTKIRDLENRLYETEEELLKSERSMRESQQSSRAGKYKDVKISNTQTVEVGTQTIYGVKLESFIEEKTSEEEVTYSQLKGHPDNSESLIVGSEPANLTKTEANELQESINALEVSVVLLDDDTIQKVQEELSKEKGNATLKAKEVKLLRNFYDQNKDIQDEIDAIKQEQQVLKMERDEYEVTVNEKEE